MHYNTQGPLPTRDAEGNLLFFFMAGEHCIGQTARPHIEPFVEIQREAHALGAGEIRHGKGRYSAYPGRGASTHSLF